MIFGPTIFSLIGKDTFPFSILHEIENKEQALNRVRSAHKVLTAIGVWGAFVSLIGFAHTKRPMFATFTVTFLLMAAVSLIQLYKLRTGALTSAAISSILISVILASIPYVLWATSILFSGAALPFLFIIFLFAAMDIGFLFLIKKFAKRCAQFVSGG